MAKKWRKKMEIETWRIVKLGLSLALAALLAWSTSACGLKIGNTVIGTTGYLEEYNVSEEIKLYGRRIREQLQGQVDSDSFNLLDQQKKLRG